MRDDISNKYDAKENLLQKNWIHTFLLIRFAYYARDTEGRYQAIGVTCVIMKHLNISEE